MADFKTKDDDLVKAVPALAAVAKNGDEGAFRQSARVVSDTCRACHDSYRDN
jgi:cytochrome c556